MLNFFYARVEVKKRELISRLELSVEFLREGVPILIGDQVFDRELESVSSLPGYYFGKCAQPAVLNSVRSLVEKGWVCGALDEEGLLPNNLESFARQRFNVECSSYFSDLFFFGEAQKKYFQHNYPGIQCLVSGNPRIDAWKSNYYGIHDSLASRLRSEFGTFYLFPLNYSYYTNSDLRHKSASPGASAEFRDLSSRSEFLFDKVCKLSQQLSGECNVKVVLRPHPADSPGEIRRLIARHGVTTERVICDARFDVYPWIIASLGLVHNCCTTSLEAGFAGKSVASYIPNGVSLYDDSSINNMFPLFTSGDSLIRFFANESRSQGQDFFDRIRSWDRLDATSIGCSSTRIASAILSRHSFCSGVHVSFESSKLASSLDLFRNIRSRFGGSSRRVYRKKFPGIDAQEVSSIVEKILAFKHLKLELRYQKVGPRLVAIIP